MVLNSKAKIKEIFKMGKEYVWQKPAGCLRCGNTVLWGHGYVERYSDGYADTLWIRRYRCPECGCVYTMRPQELWPRFQAHVVTIIQSLSEKVTTHKWLTGISRQRQQYWFRGIKKQCRRMGMIPKEITKAQITQLCEVGIIITTHSMLHYQTHSVF